MMQVIYTGEEMPQSFTKSIFLAGPSFRPGQEKEMESWRKDAIKILEDIGYDGLIFCPENRDGKFDNNFSYDNQIGWEEKYLNIADCIVFWIPRNLSLDNEGNIKLPAFTTNIEWGAWASSGKVVLGAPEDAEKMSYLKHYAEELNVPFSDTLTGTLREAMDKLGDGAERSGGERYVPLFIWELDSFQSWYQAQTNAGNSLEEARLLFNFRPRFKDFVFLWILKVKVYVSSEDRYKDNEFVLSRPDISAVCLWRQQGDETKVILIKEFRSSASTADGFIYELPSGSSHSPINPEQTASEELFEETGFELDSSRLKKIKSRQLAGTLSAHKAHLYAAELSSEELEWFESEKDVAHGNQDESEKTFIEVRTIKDLLNNNLVDWATLGQLLSVISDR